MMSFKNIEKRRAYRRIWYSKNKESEKRHIKNRKIKIRKWLADYRNNLSCAVCGESHPAIIDFHHKKGTKEKAISNMVRDGHSIDRIKKEMKKCIILCSNCHRKLHYKKHKLY